MNQKLYQIYLITNIVNNKKYVGQVIKSRGYKVRFTEHLYTRTAKKLSSAIKCYGKEAFRVELVEDDIPEYLIDIRERYYIDYYDTFYINGNGYNMTKGGQGIHGYHQTAETCSKISKASNSTWTTLKQNPEKLCERNLKISSKLKNIPKTAEAREKLSKAAKARFSNSDGTFKGKHHSEESKNKISRKNGYAVAMIDKKSCEILCIFSSASKASEYLIEKGITKNRSAFTRILTICNKIKGQGTSAYGYKWEFVNESVSTIPAGSRAD